MKSTAYPLPESSAVQAAFQKSLFESQSTVDRTFARILVVQWLFGILCSVVVSPLAWEGAESHTHVHVWSAIFLGGLIVSLPVALVSVAPGKLFTRLSVASSQLLFSALLIHLMGGRIEAHFHIFVSLAMLKAYRDYRVFVPAVLITLADHLIRGYWWPQSVFGDVAVITWRPFEHAAWVLFETVALCLLIRRNLQQLRSLSSLQCSLTDQCTTLERRVEERTKELHDAKLFQERILNSIEAQVCILDERGKVIFANEPWREFAASNSADHESDDVGQSYIDACITEKDEFSEQPTQIAQAFHEIQAGNQKSFSCEYRYPADLKQRRFHVGVTPFQLDRKHVIALTHVDVTQLDQARSRAAALAKLVLDSPHEVFLFSQETFRFIEVNAGAVQNLGYSREELLQMTPADIKPDYNETQLRELMRDLLEGKVESTKVRTFHQRKDGSTYDCSISLHCSSFEGEEVLVAFVTDVTEQTKLESQLGQARKLESIGQLAAGVAHEINTPMQCVFGNVEFLQTSFSRLLEFTEDVVKITEESQAVDLSEVQEKHRFSFLKSQTPMALSEAAQASKQVISVIRAMKCMSHPGTAEKSMTDIHDMLHNAATITRSRWKNVASIEFDLDPNLGMIEVLPAEISQVFINMIVNAADAIIDKIGDEPNELGAIRIATRNEGNHACIEFADSGVGIPLEIQKQIFGKFFTTKEVGKGTGQGLAISNEVIAEKHGGHIQVISEEGVGTTFVLTIPRAAQIEDKFIPSNSDHWAPDNPVELA